MPYTLLQYPCWNKNSLNRWLCFVFVSKLRIECDGVVRGIRWMNRPKHCNNFIHYNAGKLVRLNSVVYHRAHSAVCTLQAISCVCSPYKKFVRYSFSRTVLDERDIRTAVKKVQCFFVCQIKLEKKSSKKKREEVKNIL